MSIVKYSGLIPKNLESEYFETKKKRVIKSSTIFMKKIIKK